jgi:acyl-coenzyme A synthetase/AMP-(fatty) acid ligase
MAKALRLDPAGRDGWRLKEEPMKAFSLLQPTPILESADLPTYDAPYNLIDALLLKHLANGHGDRPALIFDSLVISYSELARAVIRARALLEMQSIGRSDRVGLVVPDVPAYVYLLLAAISLGAIAVPISPKHNVADAHEMLRHVGASTVFVLDALAAAHAGSEAARAGNLRVISVTPTLDDAHASGGIETFAPEVTVGGDVLYLLFSSGTTGRPKAIQRRHADIAHTAMAFGEDVLMMSPHDRVVAVPKLTFGYALAGNLLFSLIYGATSILTPQISTAETMLAAIRRHRPTIFLAQPRMLAELAELIGEPAEVRSIRATVSAGDVLSDAVRDRWSAKTGLEIIDGFGSTEVGHIFLCNKGSARPHDSVGTLLRGYQAKIVGENGAALGDGTPGRLCIRGASLTTGYWNDPERTLAAFRDGWFMSDDLFVTKDSHFFYAGRRDDMVKTGCGEWVAPHHVENVLLRAVGVRDCAVVGAHDEREVVRVKAYVVREPSSESDQALARRLMQLPAQEWPALDHMRVHMIEFIDSIPRSINGKIQRHRLAPKTLSEFAYEC